ncbi:MAG TPA: porin [Ferruginibacter sp.]|nr:porin [Ferruginibacter sp.]HMP20732.1 porin [Ferruginibacter sp.]
MDLLDTTKEAGKGLLGVYQKFDRVRIGGYIQPQFQLAQSQGIKSYEGVDFAANVNNRFMLRRSRIRIDYLHMQGEGEDPGVQIVFQFDANERRFTLRDVWGRVFENHFKLFSLTAGMFARPFGFETNLSSSDRETPERGRMNQILMRSERDLGAMITLDARKQVSFLRHIKIDAGFFNGQGINAEGDFDNRKDFIGRIALKPLQLNTKITLAAGTSLLYGGLLQNTRYAFSTVDQDGFKKVITDSAATNKGRYSPRTYKGADVQLKINNSKGATELRAEYIYGVQTGTANNTETPVALVNGSDGFYRRNFAGAYFYFLQHLFSSQHQLVLKYDWYDPNTKVKDREIGVPGSNFTAADIKYSTFNIGYNYYIQPLVKLSLFYAIIKNEATLLEGYEADLADNVFTARLQFRF